MGAAALVGRLPRGRTASAAVTDAALGFHAPGGPLVVVCGLVGGAGATTLAYLLARRAARHSSTPVLLAELHDGAGLAALTQTGGPLGLRGLAAAVADEREVGRPFTELAGGLRLVARAPDTLAQPAPAEALTRVLTDARAAHGLTVVDAGQPAAAERGPLLDAASHVLFVLPATPVALAQAQLLAAGGLFRQAAGASTTLVVVATQPARGAPRKQLRRLAEAHVDRLLLVPHIADLAAGQLDHAEPRLEASWAALATILRRVR